MLMHRLIYDAAARTPDRIAFRWVDRQRTLTYASAVGETEAMAGALHSLGVAKGDRVSIVAHNGMDYLVAMLGCWRIGAIAALVSVRFVDELDYFLGDHTPKVVIYTHDIGERVREVARHIPGIAHLVCMDGPQDGALSLPALMQARLAAPSDPGDETAIAHLSYTSGSTGQPKGACLAHEPTVRAACCIAERLRIGSDDVSFGPTALSSSYQLVGNLLPGMARGITINVMGRWTRETGCRALAETSATMLVANPILLADVLEEVRNGGLKPATLRLAMSGGAPVSPELKRAFRDELALPLVESYGQSELGGFVALGAPDLPDDYALGAIGRPLPDKEVRIFDARDRDVKPGEVGEIRLRGGFMAGYWGRPEKTAEALRGGWLNTGDAGTIEADGLLRMRGRFSELIEVSGRTWYPRDVEEVLARHADVADAAVVGIPDAGLGQRPFAFVVLRRPMDLVALKRGIAGGLAFDIDPLVITALDAFPMTPTGKIAKMELKDRAARILL